MSFSLYEGTTAKCSKFCRLQKFLLLDKISFIILNIAEPIPLHELSKIWQKPSPCPLLHTSEEPFTPRMDVKIRKRSVYPSTKQKRKLVALITQHPQLLSFKVTEDFKQRDYQILWNNIAAECNSLPGSRKTWRQWRKTWQDLRSKIKKKEKMNSDFLTSTRFTTEEREALGLKNVSSTTSYQDTVEFVAPEDESTEDNVNGFDDTASFSEPGSPPEVKDEVLLSHKSKNILSRNSQDHSDSCVFNCDRLVAQEQRKIQIKEDYLNFKKDYLRQKLLLMKEQTEALKEIASSLAK